MLLAILRAEEHLGNECRFKLRDAQTLAKLPPDDVPVPHELARLLTGPTIDEWQGLIALIGCTPGAKNVMHDPSEMQQRPLFVLPGNRLLLCDICNGVDQLWRAFEDLDARSRDAEIDRNGAGTHASSRQQDSGTK